MKTQALDTPLSLLLRARASATVSTQRVQTHPVHPTQVGAWATPWHKAAPSVSRAPGLVQLGGSTAKVSHLTWTGGRGVNRSPWERSRSVHRPELPSPPGVDRGHLSRAAGLVEAGTSGVPSLLPRAGWRLDPAEPSSCGTIVPNSLGVLPEPPEKSSGGRRGGGSGSGPPEPRGRLSLLGHSQRRSHACPAQCAGHSEALSVRARGPEGVWPPRGLVPTAGRAGLWAIHAPGQTLHKANTAPGRGDLELIS